MWIEVFSQQKGIIDISAHHTSQYLWLGSIDVCKKLFDTQKLFEIAKCCCSSIAKPIQGNSCIE